MIIKEAQFVESNTDFKKCPRTTLPEFAFIGRSNVGKSSLINMLAQHKKLAKTSSTPGKTQLINHFIINKAWYLVDLPGYGWAKVSKTLKAKWVKMTRDYLTQRQNLSCVFVLIDVRLEPQRVDVEFINWLGEKGIPFAIIFTKADKQKEEKSEEVINTWKSTLLGTWEELPPYFLSSAVKAIGKTEILGYIDSVYQTVKNE